MEIDGINILIMLTMVMVAWVIRLKCVNRTLTRQVNVLSLASAPVTVAQTAALEGNGELLRLRERVAVLERITVDKENTLSREIDGLRDR